jgi:hypothetical protein
MEALRQDVAEETADELTCCERHDFVARSAAIILVAERDAGLVERNQSAIGDGNTVGVARQIGKHRLGSAERALCVDIPFAPAQRREVARESLGFGEMGILVEELQLAGLMCGEEPRKHQPAEQLGEYPHRQEAAGAARHPA